MMVPFISLRSHKADTETATSFLKLPQWQSGQVTSQICSSLEWMRTTQEYMESSSTLEVSHGLLVSITSLVSFNNTDIATFKVQA